MQSRGSSYSRAVEWFLIMLRLLMGGLCEESLVKYIGLGTGCHLMWTRLTRVDDVEIRVRSVRFAAKTKHRNIEIVGRSIRISQKLDIGTTKFKPGASDLPQNNNSGNRNSGVEHATRSRTPPRDIEIPVRSVRFMQKKTPRGIPDVNCGEVLMFCQGVVPFPAPSIANLRGSDWPGTVEPKTIHLLLVAAPCNSSSSRESRKSFLWRCTHGKPSPKA